MGNCSPLKAGSHFAAIQDPEVTKPGKNVDRKLCFGLEDFRIGTFVRIYSRDFFIHDCDDFTRQWYQVGRHRSESTQPKDSVKPC